ncbi:beta-lactamase-like protein [Entophlyctis helioformis]|nr:beta-lactamase-like protein [Entophlyctis helioformis]
MLQASSSSIRVVPLGAGQDVGRSCVLVSMGGKNIMFDCGMHMGHSDHRRFPDFAYISKTGDFTGTIDCVIISHFHLDHCGALPYFTEICGYNGPIYMTHPTRAIAPILLEDMRKVVVERKGETDFFNAADIKNCMRKVIPVSLLETVWVDAELEIRPYYAGHVLGAAMFYVRVTDGYGVSQSVVYTGDYNMTPDRHLGPAQIEPCEPDLIITETTYATTIRDSKRARERDFLKRELLILIESYWRRMDDLSEKVPVYFSTGLTERANEYYKLFISWTNENIKRTFVERNMFDFGQIRGWEHSNMIILPGYCVAGTVGAKVLAGEKVIDMDRFTKLHVNMQVNNLSFSAHADAKGILQLIRMSRAKNVMLVHGEKHKMAKLRTRIERELGICCFDPANGVTVHVPTETKIPVLAHASLVSAAYAKERPTLADLQQPQQQPHSSLNQQPIRSVPLDAAMVIEPPRTETVITTAPAQQPQSQPLAAKAAPATAMHAPLVSSRMVPAQIRLFSLEDSKLAGQVQTPSLSLTISKLYNPMVLLSASTSASASAVNGSNPAAAAAAHASSATPDLTAHEIQRMALARVHDKLRSVLFDMQGIPVALEDKGLLVCVGETVRVYHNTKRACTLDVSWKEDDETLAVKTLALVNQALN